MRFEFYTPTRIILGSGACREIGALSKGLGRQALLVCGQDASRAAELVADLASAGVETAMFPLSGEPTTEIVQRGTAFARSEACDFIIGFGGGSAIDTAKAIAALLRNQGDLFDFLEIVGRGKPVTQPSAPCIAIPTTAGTGAEVTKNAVLASPAHRVKVSMRSPFMTPSIALIDPELTLSLPPKATANTGLDALTQLIEPFVCTRANPMTDALCREGMMRAARSLRTAFQHGENLAAREDMCVASLFGGLALANAGLGAVHGFAGPIGGMFNAPHGGVCAALLPHVMAINIRALRQRAPATIARYTEVARILTGRSDATAEDGAEWVAELVKDLSIRSLGSYEIKSEHVNDLIDKAQNASSMKPNPIPLTRDELREILERAL